MAKTKQTKPCCFIRSEFGFNTEITDEQFEEIVSFLKEHKTDFRLVLSSNGVTICK